MITQVIGLNYITSCHLNTRVLSLGYPVPNYGGQRMVESSSPLSTSDSIYNPNTLGMQTSQGEGSSGGPRFLVQSQKRIRNGAYICSVNSYQYQGNDQLQYGPYFDTAVSNLYFQALAM
jgi:hypothetical protein